jgi:NADH-quinone oxidoreductase subunit M
MQQYLLSFLIFTPLLAALFILLTPYYSEIFYKRISITASIFQILAILVIVLNYEADRSLQFVEKFSWITLDLGSWGILKADYYVALDGLNTPLVCLAVVIMFIATLASWNVSKQTKGYFSLLLILNSAIIGSFTAFDFLLFYLFFEFMLLPMFFLIGIWGGPRREYASIKFFLYTLLGSILILIVIIGLYISFNDPSQPGRLLHSFNIVNMTDPVNIISNSILDPNTPWIIAGLDARLWAFLLLFMGFAIKLPMVPLHTWLPDAHVEASTPISVILAALLLKVGGYGLIRIAYPIFPDGAVYFSTLVGVLGIISIVYGAFNALGSKDLKRLIAYSSVSHMGFVLLGLASVTTEGVTGAVYQMFSHGIISAMLFILAGVLYDRTQNRLIADYSGLAGKMPAFFVFVLIAFFASMGLPGFSGFIAEILVLLGAFKSASANGLLHESLAIIATVGLVLGAAYFLWTIQRMFFGTFHFKGEVQSSALVDLSGKEFFVLLPLALATLAFGIFPQVILDWINPFAEQFVQSVLETGATLTSHP